MWWFVGPPHATDHKLFDIALSNLICLCEGFEAVFGVGGLCCCVWREAWCGSWRPNRSKCSHFNWLNSVNCLYQRLCYKTCDADDYNVTEVCEFQFFSVCICTRCPPLSHQSNYLRDNLSEYQWYTEYLYCVSSNTYYSPIYVT